MLTLTVACCSRSSQFEEAREVLHHAVQKKNCDATVLELEQLLFKIKEREHGPKRQSKDSLATSSEMSSIRSPDARTGPGALGGASINIPPRGIRNAIVTPDPAIEVQIVPVNQRVVQSRKQNDDDEFHILVKHLGGQSSLLKLHEDGSVADLRKLVASRWKDDRLAVRINGQQVTDPEQPLSAHGFAGSRCLLIVTEVVYVRCKLKGGMEK